MSVDRTKILEAAQKHLAKGAYDKAIAELQKLVKADPSDVRTWLKIGDLHAKKGSTRDAVDTYARVADQYATQGFFLKAVAVHKQILKLDPSRLDVQLKLADAYENLQLVSDALATYEQVAAGYARAGNIDKALATLGKMVELDRENIPVRIKYAEALSKANRTKEAADAFEAGGKLLKAQGRIDDWIKVAERLLFHRADDVAVARELSKLYLERRDAKRALAKLQICFKADPKDVPTLEMLAEAFHQLGQLPKTISVHREVARIHQEANRVEDRARTLKRILDLDPGDAEARQALAAYAQPRPAPAAPTPPPPTPAPPAVARPSSRVVPPPSAAPLRRDVAPPPGAVIAAPPSAPSAPPDPDLEELDENSLEEHDAFDATDADDTGAGETLGAESAGPDLASARGGEAAGGEEYADDTYEGADDADVIIVDADEEDLAARGSTRPPARSELPPEIARDAQIAKLLTECEVFLRYGLKQKVIDQLRRVLQLDANHVEARERLKDLLIERGEIAVAIDELVVLADLFAVDRPAVALLYLRQALELDPESAHVQARIAAITSGEAPRPARSSRRPSARASQRPEGGQDEGVFFVDEEDETGYPTGERAELAPAPLASDAVTHESYAPPVTDTRVAMPPPALGPDDPEELEAITAESQGLRPPPIDDGTAEDLTGPDGHDRDALRAAASGRGASDVRGGDPLAPMSPEEFESAPLRASDAPRDQVARRVSMPPGEVEELLDEADFFVAQGLFEEAKAILRDSLAAHPRNTLIADKLAEVEEIAAQQPSAAARSVPPEGDRSFQLAERLAEDLGEAEEEARELGSDVLDVEQVFAQFKKGVEQQVGLEDTETHFDLGIAYKEMGLLQDAISEFQLCLANPQKQCIAHTMIGLCFLEKSETAEAISSFKKGLYAENKTDREELGLYYELGRAYELLHDPKESLYYYEKVRKRDATFRNVGDRILALTRPAPAAPPPASSASDDIDAAFDDLMGDRED